MEAGLVWLHVACGVIWIAVCAALAIGSVTLAPDSAEFVDFTRRAVPPLIRTAVLAAFLLLLSGAARLLMLGESLAFGYPAAFLIVLGAKLVLFVAMGFATAAARRGAEAMATVPRFQAAALMKRIGMLSAATLAMGGVALGLGMWLAGAA